MGKLMIWSIRLYQFLISPLIGNCCRFHPSCSDYWITAIEKHGCFKGVCLGTIRLCKCHPFHPGGVDFVPESKISGHMAHE